MYRNVIIIVAGLLFAQYSIAQRNNIWYFGVKGGLSFNPSVSGPVPAVLSNSAMVTNEGCSSICDSDGNLLFYSNGVSVYNRNHQVMLNGDNLAGNISSVQACVIIPVPGSSFLYYIFTSDAFENSFENGYNYSIVNMNGDGGNGEIISKNVSLWSSCTERMVAARHANGSDVWLITNDNNSNIFRSWLIDCNGLNTTPIVSTIGLVMNQHFTVNNGMLKVSPDGRQLCQTSFPEVDVTTFIPNFFQLFDFNNTTGAITNPRTITLPNSKVLSCEYSSDSKLLYLCSPGTRTIEQVEATLPTVSAIEASQITINTAPSAYYGIQSAPDDKIYLADIRPALGAINRPNTKGVGCNYVNQQIRLSPGSSYLSLPAYINDFSASPTNGFTYLILDSCTGRVQFNGFTTMPGTVIYEWDFGDGNTSNVQNPIHTFNPVNLNYKVRLKISTLTGCGEIERSKTLFPSGLSVNATFDFVSKCDSGYVRFTNTSTVYPDTATVSYQWDFDDGNTSAVFNPVHSFSGSGSFDVRLSIRTSTPCLDRSVVHTLNLETLNITAPADIEIDAGQAVPLSVSGGGSSFVWTPNRWLTDDSIANPIATPNDNITYKVVVRNDAGCSDSDFVSIKVRPLPGIYMPTGFTPDNDGLNDLVRPIITKEFTLQQFAVYNRWGQKIFATSQIGAGWNGMINGVVQDSGVYVWTINATDTRTNKKHELKGTFTIIRR